MQTRAGRRTSSSLQQILKEIRIPSKKRHANSGSTEAAPLRKKRKSTKTVRFEQVTSLYEDNDEISSVNGTPIECEDLAINSCGGLQCAPDTEDEDSLAGIENYDMEILGDEEFINTLTRRNPFSPNSIRFHHTHPHPYPQTLPSNPTFNPYQLPISPDQIYKDRYISLKISTFNWATTYFPQPPSPPSTTTTKPLNLPHLCSTFPHLMKYANYISACGPLSTWEDVFDEQRTFLVYGILGKMLEVHVFGCEMFGGSEREIGGLRKGDEEGVMDDGLMRQEKRSFNISQYLKPRRSNSTLQKNLPSNFLSLLSALQASFMHMLSPLLSPDHTQTRPKAYTTHLSQILLEAANLSLDIRREPNILYHWHPHPSVGTLFTTRTMHDLDPDADHEDDFRREPTDVRVVTMAGWPSLVAYGPRSNPTGPKSSGNVGNAKHNHNFSFIRVLARAEVLVRWGQPVRPLVEQPTNWLGPCLRDEMRERVMRMDREEKTAVIGSGVAVGAALAMGWVFQQPWVVEGLKGLGGLVGVIPSEV